MSDHKYEHRVVVHPAGADGTVAFAPTEDASDAGRRARECRKLLTGGPGGAVEIQRRAVGEWETVERTEVQAPGGARAAGGE